MSIFQKHALSGLRRQFLKHALGWESASQPCRNPENWRAGHDLGHALGHDFCSSRRCLESVWGVSGRCLESVWKVSGRCLDVVFGRFWSFLVVFGYF